MIRNLIGKKLTKIDVNRSNEDTIIFYCEDGSIYKMYHEYDCRDSENVYVDDICGDIHDLLNHPIILAEESTNNENPKEDSCSFTWTFYKLATEMGYVTIRWYSCSNGFYSEKVSFEQLNTNIEEL